MDSHILKWGNSLALRIPSVLTKELGMKEGTPIEINIKDNQVIITKKELYSLQAFIEQMTEENMNHENFDDTLVGKEEW